MHTRRPWYGFLYYLLGAQGSFFVWVACVLGLYLTRKEAVLYVFNRQPVRTSVREIRAGELGFRRWVEIGGTELDLAAIRAALSPETPETTPLPHGETILIDPDTEAAGAWRALLDALDRLAASAIDDPEQLTTALWKLVHEPNREPERYRPAAGVVVVPGTSPERPRTPSTSAGIGQASAPVGTMVPAPASTSARVKQFDATAMALQERAGVRALRAWLARLHDRLLAHVSEPGYPPLLARSLLRKLDSTGLRAVALRAAVRPAVQRRGLLHRLPRSRIRHYQERHGVQVAPFALVTGQRPHYLAALIFGVFASLLFFLVVGLFALRAPEQASE